MKRTDDPQYLHNESQVPPGWPTCSHTRTTDGGRRLVCIRPDAQCYSTRYPEGNHVFVFKEDQ